MTASGEYKATNGRRKIIRDQISGFTKRLEAIKNQPEPVKIRRKAKMKIKPSLIAIYASVFALVVVIIFTGYQQPVKVDSLANIANANSKDKTLSISVDDVVATSVAAVVARSASLPVAPNIANLAISTQTQFQFDQANSLSMFKPQITESGSLNRLITSYTVKAGETIDSIAANFKISKDTIKWANNLVYDNLSVGKILRILPVDGVAYVVKNGDTVDSLADKYKVDKARLIVFNDLDVSGLVVGNEIILPNGILPKNERPGYIAPIINYSSSLGGNTYDYGNCTWYAYNRRMQLGKPVGNNLGNANTWAINTGYSGNHKPTVGAVMVRESGIYGHVAIVESINESGDIYISEMNSIGWNVYSERTISSGQAAVYSYIP